MNNKQLSVVKRNWLGSDKLQTLLLVLTTVTMTFTLGKSFLHKTAKSPQFSHYQFPNAIALSQWKFYFSRSINSNVSLSLSGELVAEKHYRYRQNGKYLKIEMRYAVDTDGDLKSFITDGKTDLSSGLREDDAGGFYSVYTNDSKVNLIACINPSGGSTVTGDRFRRNRMLYDNHFERIVPWLRGQKELLDKRCLWTHLSMDLDRNVSLNEHYRILETAWFDWYEYWQINYPEARLSRGELPFARTISEYQLDNIAVIIRNAIGIN